MGWGVSHSLSCPTAPARDKVGQGAAWADPARGISHLPGASGGQGWDRSLGCPGPPFHASWRNGAGKAALSLSQPWAGSHIPREVCSQSPHSPLREVKDSWECISSAERRGRKSPSDACVIFARDPCHLKRGVGRLKGDNQQGRKHVRKWEID